MTSTPLIMVSGALGSGKTTFVRAVIADNPNVRFGVIVNEFGETGIDGDLLRPYVMQIVEIRNGCICCTTQDQFLPAVRELLARYVVDILMIEMSGAADPLPVERNLHVLRPMIELRRQIALVDATAEPGTATRDHGFRNSLAVADLAILSKTDIASCASIARWRDYLAGFACGTELIESIKGNVPLALVLGRRQRAPHPLRELTLDDHQHKLSSVCYFINATTRDRLQRFADCYARSVERFKGVVLIDSLLTEVHGVRGRLDLVPYRGAPLRGRLVFISSVLAQSSLRAAVLEHFVVDEAAALPSSLDSPGLGISEPSRPEFSVPWKGA